MDVVALSEMALVLGAFLGALAVSLVGLRIQVKRDTETWARSYWEAGTRQLVEIEAKAATQTLSLDDDPPPSSEDGAPVSEGDPNEDPAERRRRERQERAARIRERIAQKRIAEKVMEESPDDVPANYVGPPAFGGEGATGEVEAAARRAPPRRGYGYGGGAPAPTPVAPTMDDEQALFGDVGLGETPTSRPATAAPPTVAPPTAAEPAMPRAPRPAPRPPERPAPPASNPPIPN
ncbi:MAG: hypothetical protein JNM72_05590, partial [Deltaproteobacteria bacterium]|nr:hypothetical protein [Deltaproteobacteria bacterium]